MDGTVEHLGFGGVEVALGFGFEDIEEVDEMFGQVESDLGLVLTWDGDFPERGGGLGPEHRDEHEHGGGGRRVSGGHRGLWRLKAKG